MSSTPLLLYHSHLLSLLKIHSKILKKYCSPPSLSPSSLHLIALLVFTIPGPRPFCLSKSYVRKDKTRENICVHFLLPFLDPYLPKCLPPPLSPLLFDKRTLGRRAPDKAQLPMQQVHLYFPSFAFYPQSFHPPFPH